MKADLIKTAEAAFYANNKVYPAFKSGDTITVTYRIVEETKERLQKFKGVVIQRRGQGNTQTFTVRKISEGIGVERIFPVNSPFIDKIELTKAGKVRRARIFYLRKLTGKKARIKEKKIATATTAPAMAVATAATE
ncbi:MAG: 50S ribosomal protein L19 [Prevotellaceae bacterium]|jgi:large subunit ribosomal protein L19|nr:50S ribosomal protein L19 [Prevotellaceae bacterium]